MMAKIIVDADNIEDAISKIKNKENEAFISIVYIGVEP